MDVSGELKFVSYHAIDKGKVKGLVTVLFRDKMTLRLKVIEGQHGLFCAFGNERVEEDGQMVYLPYVQWKDDHVEKAIGKRAKELVTDYLNQQQQQEAAQPAPQSYEEPDFLF